MLKNTKDWFSTHKLQIMIVFTLITDFLLITESQKLPTGWLAEIIKTYAGLIGIVITSIPAWYIADATRKKIQQETENLKIDQDTKMTELVGKLKSDLADELEENLGKSQTLKSLNKKIEMQDVIIQSQTELNAQLTNRISDLTNKLALEQAAGIHRDEQIAQLTEELTVEKGLRATAQAELEDLKRVSDKLSEEHTKKITNLLERIKLLEDELRKHDWPIPTVSCWAISVVDIVIYHSDKNQ